MAPTVESAHASDPQGPTAQLCNWIRSMSLQHVPKDVQTRAKYLILDGMACALIGAQLPWSKTAAASVFAMEAPGKCGVFGWDKVR